VDHWLVLGIYHDLQRRNFCYYYRLYPLIKKRDGRDGSKNVFWALKCDIYSIDYESIKTRELPFTVDLPYRRDAGVLVNITSLPE